MLAVRNLTRRRVPPLPFRALTRRALGSKYELSLVFIGNVRAITLNRKWRRKNQPANILSFPLDRRAGEIFLNLDRTSGAGVGPLFIHGLVHLKGLDHGSKMESLESQLIKFLNTHEQKNRRRSRPR